MSPTSEREARSFAELYILALCIWREARGESFRGKMLVGATIRNRVEDPRWPNTYEGVITQKWQFSAFNPHDPNAVKYPNSGAPSAAEDAAWLSCIQAADTILRSDARLTTANHYHTTAIRPGWSDESKVVEREGHHVFLAL